MGTTTFSGPVKAGTIKDTTGTTVGTDVNNVGFVLMAQSAVIDIVGATDTSTVGVGTTFADNIYIVHQVSNVANNGILTCNVLSTTNLSNFNVSGTTSQPCGRVSWGRISGFSRSSTPVSIGVTGLTVDSGLSTFPTIQRRGTGFNQTGGAGL